MVDVDRHADLFEIRGDLVRDLDLLTVLRTRSKPLLFTCRAASEGGRAPDAHPSRKETLLEAVKRGFEYVDVEHLSPIFEVMAAKSGKGLVVSNHDLTGTPADLDRLYADMCARGADIVKIVTTPQLDRRRGPAPRVRRAHGRQGRPASRGPGHGPPRDTHPDPGRPLRRPLHLRERRRGGGVRAGADPGVGHGRALSRALDLGAHEGLRHPRDGRAEEPLSADPQPRLRGLRPRRGLRAAPGGEPGRLPRRRERPSASPASASLGPTRSRSSTTSRRSTTRRRARAA